MLIAAAEELNEGTSGVKITMRHMLLAITLVERLRQQTF
jgi:hypothetical protein